MNITIIEERLNQYRPDSKAQELHALKEIVQEITLRALSRSEFFKKGAFQGGTCLRIIYGLPRFSEDLDFILFEPNPSFRWAKYLEEIRLEFETFGLVLEIKDRSEVDGAVKKAFLKDNSFGKVLKLKYQRERSDPQTIQIKLEIDTNPPAGSSFETKLLEFPSPFSIITQTLPSLFAGKLHALLSRSHVKGRDWYDFTWYASRNTSINFMLLQNALYQQGPWAGQPLEINLQWLLDQLHQKIQNIDWKMAKRDVEVFLRTSEATSLQLWSSSFFEHFLNKLQTLR